METKKLIVAQGLYDILNGLALLCTSGTTFDLGGFMSSSLRSMEIAGAEECARIVSLMRDATRSLMHLHKGFTLVAPKPQP